MKANNLYKYFIVSVLFTILICILPSYSNSQINLKQKELDEKYYKAVKDAEVAEPHEISKNLVAIVPWNNKLVWTEDKEYVLVVSWMSKGANKKFKSKNNRKTSKLKKNSLVINKKPIWVTTVPALKNFCKKNNIKKKNLDLRLKQLLGLPPCDKDKKYKKIKFVQMWVKPDDLFRPSPDPEISDHEAELDFPVSENFLKITSEYIKWFCKQKCKSYGRNGYPWTRLGYTYDWGNPDSEVGLSEFVIQKGAEVKINSIIKTEKYCSPN